MQIGMGVRHFWPEKLTLLPRTAAEIAKGLAARGHSVTIVTNTDRGHKEGDSFLQDGVKVQRTANPFQALIAGEFDVLKFFGSLLGAYLLARRSRRVPLMLYMYSSRVPLGDFFRIRFSDVLYDRRVFDAFNPFLANLLPASLATAQLRHCHKMVVQSQRMESFWLTRLGSDRVVRIPHGIDFETFANTEKEKVRLLRQNLGLSEENKILLYLGHPFLTRGIDDVIRAMVMVLPEVPKARLLLVIDTDPRRSLNRVSALASNSSLGGSVKILAEWVENPQEYYALADVVALPYRFSPELPEYPFALLEAMASARPVVTTAIGAIPEIVQDGHSGLLAPPRDPRALARAICRVLRDDDLGHRLGENAQERVRGLDWHPVVGKVLAMLESLQ